MKIRHKGNGGLATVCEEFGRNLVASGAWEEIKPKPKPAPQQAPKRQAPKRRQTRRTRKTNEE